MSNIDNSEFEKYQRAKNKVKEIKDFYSHLITYVFVISFLVFINLKFSPGHLWFFWPMMGWGIGLFFHGLKVFDVTFMSKDWEEKKIREYMEEEKKNKSKFE
jgi:hypothetical protein